MRRRRLALLSLAMAWVSGPLACSDDAAGGGQLQLVIDGADAIEEILPASATDGWAVTFDRFLVHVGSASAAGLSASDVGVIDLAQRSNGQGHITVSGDASGGAVGSLDVSLTPATQDPAPNNASTDDVRVMAQRRYAMFIEGTATKAAETRDFAWGFGVTASYAGCATAAVVGDGVADARLRIDPARGFWPTLERDAPRGVFDAVADADTDADGTVTEAELRAVDITTLTLYDRGSRSDVTTLWDFLGARFAAVGMGDAGACQ